MPLIATKGAASAQGFGEFAQSAAPVYIEDVMSVYLYTGNGSTQTITNGIDLSGKGGLTWIKQRSAARNNLLFDTTRGATKPLYSNLTAAEGSDAQSLTAFTSTGFSVGSDSGCNINAGTYASWTFREQAKFFDVVTYTGNGVNGRQISHALGSVPGCIIVKRTSSTGDWNVYHRSLGNNDRVLLNLTNAAATTDVWFDTTPTSTVFYVDDATLNINGETYVAYLFAHDAGGFGLTGTDNVISCGSFTTNGSGQATVSLGYEPQYILYKRTDSTSDWNVADIMRGWTADVNNNAAFLRPNVSNAEYNQTAWAINSTGFYWGGGAASGTYIYIAIRRGPMKTPTSGTSVFAPVARTGTGAAATVTTNFAPDFIISHARNAVYSTGVWDRLRGVTQYLETTGTAAEATSSDSVTLLPNTAYVLGLDSATDRINRSGDTYANWAFGRAPGFFDVVCVTGGSGTVNTATHNLGVVPELVIQKYRGLADDWYVFTNQVTGFLNLNSTSARIGTTNYMTTTTSTVVNTSLVSNPANNPVIYLFATVAGVSKVGSYTGTGTTKQIDCGFTGGARFVLIKRTDSTGDWYVWDSARGIVAGNDPYLLLNSTAAEVTNTDYVDTYSAGFEISSTAPAAINANGGTFIFLAIA